MSQNSKAKSILCCSQRKKEFNRISTCKSTKEMWDKLKLTHEGTDKVRETRIDILIAQYEKFQIHSGESISQMFSHFTDITNGLARLGKRYETRDMVRKIIRSLPTLWTPKVTSIEEANDLMAMLLEKLIGSLMVHEINMKRLGESSTKRKCNNALKAAENTFESDSEDERSNGDSEEEAFLSRRLQRILAKKKHQLDRRYFKKDKTVKKTEPIYYECKQPGHLKANYPKLKQNEHQKEEPSIKYKRYKKKAIAAAWSNEDSSSEHSCSYEQQQERAHLAFMANLDDKVNSDTSFDSFSDSDDDILEDF
ncbi:hypothetical protein Taro_001076 [Colocasia esculenta]|uniref:UBN2 domain-containing protein n=1 Tax=Colocasia esculenta TaxID=4460 RepID=A0A843TDN9_COLES|nr:hypothetical protein [Colocasia esculenta]